jgi:hypothetical protein
VTPENHNANKLPFGSAACLLQGPFSIPISGTPAEKAKYEVNDHCPDEQAENGDATTSKTQGIEKAAE